MLDPMPETPLITYLRIQRATDRQVLDALRVSANAVSGELRRLQARSGAGAAMRREQVLRSQAAINRELSTLYARVGQVVESAAAEAAAAGAETILRESENLLRSVLPAADYDYMVRSAQASASQSLEVLRQRVSGSSYVPLAESVYGTENLVSGHIDNLVNAAIARGASAAELARDVRAFVNPATPGGARYASMRLARTELNNAFHAAQVKQAQEEPWVLAVKWHLSGSHPVPDECNQYAEQTHMKDGDPGVFAKGDVPVKPHPQCLCYTTPETQSPDEFIDSFMKGDFDSYLEQVGLPEDKLSNGPLQAGKKFTYENLPSVTDPRVKASEKDALKTYGDYAYRSINKGLRGEKALSTQEMKVVQEIDSLMERAVIQSDGEVFRGQDHGEFFADLGIGLNEKGLESLRQHAGSRWESVRAKVESDPSRHSEMADWDVGSAVGKTWRSPSYLSTSVRDSKFSDSSGFARKNVQMRVHVPRGSRGVTFGDTHAERELLLARGYSYTITKAELRGGIWHVDLTLNPA